MHFFSHELIYGVQIDHICLYGKHEQLTAQC